MQLFRRRKEEPSFAVSSRPEALPSYTSLHRTASPASAAEEKKPSTDVLEPASKRADRSSQRAKSSSSGLGSGLVSPTMPSPAQLHALAHKRAAEVIISELNLLVAESSLQPESAHHSREVLRVPSYSGYPMHLAGKNISTENERMRKGEALAMRASELDIAIPLPVYRSYLAMCWLDVAKKVAPYMRSSDRSKDGLAYFLGERLALTPPSHQSDDEQTFLRKLLMPTLKDFVEKGEVELLDDVEEAIRAQRSEGKRATRSKR